MNSAGHSFTDGRGKKVGLVIAVLASAEKYKGMVFYLFPKLKRKLEDCKAWIRACRRPHGQILAPPLSPLARLRGRCQCRVDGANAERGVITEESMIRETIPGSRALEDEALPLSHRGDGSLQQTEGEQADEEHSSQVKINTEAMETSYI